MSPIEYQMYTVGPFEVETQRQSEETTGETVARARAMLEAIERIETERARDRFFSELEAGVPIARRFIERKLKERREARRTR